MCRRLQQVLEVRYSGMSRGRILRLRKAVSPSAAMHCGLFWNA